MAEFVIRSRMMRAADLYACCVEGRLLDSVSYFEVKE